jgi:hypothetical protein
MSDVMPIPTLLRERYAPGSQWEDFTGCLVKVFGLARHGVTGEILVLYTCRADAMFCTCAVPVDYWEELLDNGQPGGIARFRRVGHG